MLSEQLFNRSKKHSGVPRGTDFQVVYFFFFEFLAHKKKMIEERRSNPCMSLGGLVVFALAFGAGFWINMTVAVEQESGIPLMAMFFLVVAPFPMLVFCQSPTRDMPSHLMDDDDDARNKGRDFGLLIFGLLLTLAFGSLGVALRQYKLTSGGFLLAIAGACITGIVSFMMAKCAMQGNRL